MDLSTIIEVCETESVTQVNELLSQGWILLALNFFDVTDVTYKTHVYVVGKPR